MFKLSNPDPSLVGPSPVHAPPHKVLMRDYFERLAPDLDRWSARNRYYYQDLERLHQFLVPPGSTVLEIGCGTGHLLAALQPQVGIGVDFAPTLVEQARLHYPGLTFHCLDAEALTPDALGNPTLDAILLTGVLGYLTDIQAVLERIRALCQPHTRVILCFHNYLWEPFLGLAEGLGQRRPQPPQNWLSMGDVLNLLAITGYLPVKKGRRLLFPKRIPWLSDWVNRYLAPLPGVNHLGLTNYVVARLAPSGTAALTPASALDPVTCSVIVPARNEAGNIAAVVERLPALGQHTEIIFVEGHSQDDTWATIQAVVAAGHPTFTLKAFQQSGKGKGDAVRLGFAEASGAILIILDADLTVRPEELPHFVEVIASGRGEMINGSRLVYPHSSAAMPLLNALANKFFASMFSFLLGQPLKDTLCGTKVLWRRDYERIAKGRPYFGEFDPFGDFDLLFGATKLNLHLVEVPVRYQPRTYGQSNIAHVKEGLTLLRMCLYASRKIKFI